MSPQAARAAARIEPLGVVDHLVAAAIGGVEFEHCEFRIVARRDSFVSKIAPDFEHALEAADEQALQMQLLGDAQKQIARQSVMMGGKRLRRRAAGDGLQNRRFHFEVAVRAQLLAQGAQNPAALLQHGAGVFVAHQREIGAAEALFDIGQAVKLFGRRAQRFGEQPRLVGAQRQLSNAGFEDRAARANNVAQIPFFAARERFRAQRIGAQVKLDSLVAVLERDENRLALIAPQRDSAGGFFRRRIFLQCLRAIGRRKRSNDRACGRVENRWGRRRRRAQSRQFFAPRGDW